MKKIKIPKILTAVEAHDICLFCGEQKVKEYWSRHEEYWTCHCDNTKKYDDIQNKIDELKSQRPKKRYKITTEQVLYKNQLHDDNLNI